MANIKKYLAEFFGTFVLVFVACGAAMNGMSTAGVALAFGLVIVAMAFSIGNISGCHINPAVSLAMLIRGDIDLADFIGYVAAQLAGAIAGAAVLLLLLTVQICWVLAQTTISTATAVKRYSQPLLLSLFSHSFLYS